LFSQKMIIIIVIIVIVITMVSSRRQFGDLGEKLAAKYLRDKGYKIIETNYQNNLGRRVGEIDIVARDRNNQEIVFVEVKTRELTRYSSTLPEENITQAKLRKLAKIANFYLGQKKLEKENYRFDAVSVWLDLAQKTAKIKHISHL